MSLKRSITGLPRRDQWHQLDSFARSPRDINLFQNIKKKNSELSHVNEKYTKVDKSVDWEKWEKAIGHTQLVQCMRSFHDSQMENIEKISKEDHKDAVLSQTKGWNLYDDAIKSCAVAVEKSDEIVANGARALYINANQPPMRQIRLNEFIDADHYWQAYVERNLVYFHGETLLSEGDTQGKDAADYIEWNFHQMAYLYNSRIKDTRVNANMEQPVPHDFYDLYRQHFVEHLTYYLLRTGSDYRYFPSLIPWTWLANIEDIRLKWLTVSQRRLENYQIKNLLRVSKLDLLPLEYSHGEEFFQNFILDMNTKYYETIGRLMGNWIFLSHPYVPIQTISQLTRVISEYPQGGKYYSFGADLSAIFFLPKEAKANEYKVPSPLDAFYKHLDHLTLSGKKYNPGWTSMQELAYEVIQTRGNSWLTVPGETVADGFLRRLKKDDPSRLVFETYVSELKEKMESATEIEDVVDRVKKCQEQHKEEMVAYEAWMRNQISAVSQESKSDEEYLNKLSDTGDIQKCLDNETLLIFENGKKTQDIDKLMLDMKSYNSSTIKFIESAMNQKTTVDTIRKKGN
eukprot:GHVL01025065.1.p1 GENE.GHVL01025065.1~~GHVL01025065.1.p1  ORF type:complete len:571 (-),score=107.37 GHVL01025065.1:121-1833(-)